MKGKIITGLLIGLLMQGCNHSQNHNLEHDHEQDDAKILIIAYSDELEIFAEADPFVAGKTSEILAHFTWLDDFKPLESGKITLSLITGSQGVRKTIVTPAKPGIYRFQLQPEVSGPGRIFFDVETEGRTFKIEGGEVMIFDDEHDALHYAIDNMVSHPAAISFTKEQSWLVDFATHIAGRQQMGPVIRTVGEIQPTQADQQTLTAATQGIVKMVNTSLYDGILLQNGEVLLTISGDGLAEGNATLRYREARNNFERARADYERVSKLAEERIISERELLQARNDFENVRAIFDNLSRNFSETGQVVRSPFAGHLAQLHVANGQFVEPGQPIAVIIRNNNLVIKAPVQQRYASQLQNIRGANITGPDGNTRTLEELNGRILSVSQSVNPNNLMLAVHIKTSPQPGWLPGSLTDVFLTVSSTEKYLAVPNSAILEEQGNYFVMVQIHPESFEKRQVVPGPSDGKYTAVLNGLNENERVVTRGAILVKIAATSSSLDPHAGHVH